MFTPVKFKKFYLVVSKNFETRVLEEIASLSAAQLTDAQEMAAGESESPEVYDRFLRTVQKCSSLQEALRTLRRDSQGMFPPPEAGSADQEKPLAPVRASQTETRRFIEQYESRLEALNIEVDKLLIDVDYLKAVRDKLGLLQRLGLETNSLGTRTFTEVKAGLVNNEALSGLLDSLARLRAVCEVNRNSPTESIAAIVAPKEEKEKVDDLLTKAGFREIELPQGLEPDPSKAMKEVQDRLSRRIGDSVRLVRSLGEMSAELSARSEYVNFLREATAVLSRTKDLTFVKGWIMESAVQALREKVATTTSGAYYLKIEDPLKGEQTPVLLPHKSRIMRGFELLTSIRGMPSSDELDPTVIFAVLFPIMYGMMFGDIGDGLVILVLGVILYRTKKGFIGISVHALKGLGTIMIVGGVSATAFGALYGSFFLTRTFFGPLLFDPITAFYTIVELALLFGVVQLTISLVLNIRNRVAKGKVREAVLSGKGVVGLVYYLLGMVLAARIIQGGLQLSLFFSPGNIPFTLGALACLALVFLSPLLRNLGTEKKPSEDLTEGLGEFIEVFISFLTNSLSYLRLAAFAIAHGIFAAFAVDLGASVGLISSLVLVNALVIVVDGFAAGIQSVRLLYYEFSTRFLVGAGQSFKPLKLKVTEAG